MNRRLIVLVGLALAVVGPGSPRALAQSPSPEVPPAAPAPSEALPAPSEPPKVEPAPPQEAPASAEPAALPVESLPPASAMPGVVGSPAPAPTSGPGPAVATATPGAPSDSALERSQAPFLGARPASAGPAAKGAGRDQGPLPGASESPGQGGAAAGPVDSAEREDDRRLVLPPSRLPLGRQTVGLTVDVIAPSVLNLNQMASLKIVVRNTGNSDAMGVVVRDELPEGLEFLSSQPDAQRLDALLFWNLNTLPAGAQKDITVRVKPTKVGPFEHAATVTMLAGGKSRTVVREPKLKVEQNATTGKVLKGQPVQFKIAISNPGTGPARNVIVQAKLSPGLKHEMGESLLELPPMDLEAGQRVVLDTLSADTVLAGEQSCLVVAHSSDVTTSGDEARNQATVTVVEPKLKMTVSGDEKRFTDTIAAYNITLENPGTATANNVRVVATLPLSGRPILPTPSGARWDQATGKLLWTVPQLDAGDKGKVSLGFQVRMGGVGNYQVSALAKADGPLSDNATTTTVVTGLADFEFEILERRRVVDVNDMTTFQIRIKNIGTKDATNLLVSAFLSKNISPEETNNGTDDRTKAQFNAEYKPMPLLVFPKIDRLGFGKEIVMGIKVKALEAGLGTCRAFLLHDELTKDEALEDIAAFKITAPHR